MRQNTMKTLSNLIAALLILSATFLVAGWMQSGDKVTKLNPLYAEDIAGETWEIIAPKYENPVLLGFDPEANAKVITFFYEDKQEIDDVYHALGGEYDSVNAFSYTEGQYCIIHMMRPTDWNDKTRMQTLGHEMIHCLGGKHITGMMGEVRPIPPIPPIPATNDPIHTTTVIQPMQPTPIVAQPTIVVSPVAVIETTIVTPQTQEIVEIRVFSDFEVAVMEGDIREAMKALMEQYKDYVKSKEGI